MARGERTAAEWAAYLDRTFPLGPLPQGPPCDPVPTPEDLYARHWIRELARTTLSAKEYRVLMWRFGLHGQGEHTHIQIGRVHRRSQSWSQRLCVQALGKLYYYAQGKKPPSLGYATSRGDWEYYQQWLRDMEEKGR